jgi:hypothetical protein
LERLKALIKQACVLPNETTEEQIQKVKGLEKKFKQETFKFKRIHAQKKKDRKND